MSSQQLFSDLPESILKLAVELVEQTLNALGVDPESSRVRSLDGIDRYAVRRGSARVLLSLHPPPGDGSSDDGSIRVIAPVVTLPDPDQRLELYEHLLRVNARELAGVAFGVDLDDGMVVLVAERSVRDLDASEVQGMLETIGRTADRYDDELAQAHGVQRASDVKRS
jgi:hypothetical protein